MRLGYLHFPRFPVQRRVLEQPSLTGRPLVLHADERGSQRVRFASGAALKRGVRPGMTVASALALEPGLVRLPYEPEREGQALLSLGETLLPLAPGFQRDTPEGLWLDASAAPLSGGEQRWAERVVSACRALGLRGQCVVGSERFTTQALARWAIDSVAVVPERGAGAVAALPLLALEEGWLGEGAAAPFRALGLSTLGELSGVPSGALVGRFGALGLQAARLCRGEDDSRFVADALPEVLEEQVQLDWPAEHLEPVLFALKMLVDRLCGRLQGRQLAAVRLTVTVGLEGGEPLTVPLVLARASSESRLLVELIRHRLTDLTVNQPITTLQLKVDEASADRGRQLVLGDAPSGEVELEVVLSRLQSALGEEALFSAEPLASHRPEAAWAKKPPALAREDRGVSLSLRSGDRAGERGPFTSAVGPSSTGSDRPDFQDRAGERGLRGGDFQDRGQSGADPRSGRRESLSGADPRSGRRESGSGADGLAEAKRPATRSGADGLAEAKRPATQSGADGLAEAKRPATRSGADPRSGRRESGSGADGLAEAKRPATWPKRKAKTEQRGAVSLPTLETRPPRLFQKPTRLDAELADDGALLSVTLAGQRRRVEGLSGPERLQGAWWSPEPYARDYYRLQLEGVGQLWVFRDGADGAFYAQGVFD